MVHRLHIRLHMLYNYKWCQWNSSRACKCLLFIIKRNKTLSHSHHNVYIHSLQKKICTFRYRLNGKYHSSQKKKHNRASTYITHCQCSAWLKTHNYHVDACTVGYKFFSDEHSPLQMGALKGFCLQACIIWYIVLHMDTVLTRKCLRHVLTVLIWVGEIT
jgi:hypothetical protein